MTDYAVKDSGQRQEFASGMVRDTQDGKIDFTLVLDGPMLERWADHLTKGAGKYAPRNWMLASGDAEYQRFRQSAFRHFLQWMRGETDEDHAAAVVFNLNGAEYVKAQTAPIVGMNQPDLGAAAAFDADVLATVEKYREIPQTEGGFGFSLEDHAKMGPGAKFGSHPVVR